MGAAGYRTNPFYTFYCMDNAFDIKARIRMVVRDWDRIFLSVNSTLDLLSDINYVGTVSALSARQDVPNNFELDADLDSFNHFNDKADWDDYIPMERTAGAVVGAVTIWQPLIGFLTQDSDGNATIDIPFYDQNTFPWIEYQE